MQYKFFNMGGGMMWECPSSFVEEQDDYDPDLPTASAIRLLFRDMGSPPFDAINLVSTANDGTQRWSVGPFDILIQIVEH